MKLSNPSAIANSIEWLPLAVLFSGAMALYDVLRPWALMWTLAISIFLGLKWSSWWKVQSRIPHAAWRSVAYLLAWPGMDAESFLSEKNTVPPPRMRKWLWAVLETALGVILLWAVARTVPQEKPLLRGWTGMVGLVLLLHFGIFQLAALFWQSFGVNASPIMSAPLRAESLSEFWGKRWNLGFRQLAHESLFVPLHKIVGTGPAGFLVFLVSGLVHDLVISVPARASYGLPTAYFTLQGLGVLAERSALGRQLGLRQGVRGWLFMFLFTAGPVLCLFHSAFVLHVMIPFMKTIRAL